MQEMKKYKNNLLSHRVKTFYHNFIINFLQKLIF